MCSCNKTADQDTYVVVLPDGSRKEVKGEFAARVEVTQAGGGTFSKK